MAVPRAAARYDRLLLLAPLVLSTLLAKLSVPPFADMSLGVALPMIFGVTCLGLMAGAFQVHLGRLYMYLLLAIWACVSQLFSDSFSKTSLIFLLAVFVPYLVQLKGDGRPGDAGRFDPQEFFVTVGTCVALLGCAQYAAQFVIGTALAFPIEHFLPDPLLIKGFNYLNPLRYGSSTFKANGVFFLEPSYFSQFVAISLLVELSNKIRLTRIAAHVAALACTFSGTGLIVLGCGVLTLAVARRRWDLLAVGALVVLVAVIFGDSLGLSVFLDRSSEFSSTNSSGFERFVAWTYMLEDRFWDASSRAWTGYGAGSFVGLAKVARYNAAETSFAKIIFEYGLPGITLYFGFLVYCIVTSPVAAAVKAGFIACLLMNGAFSEMNAALMLTLLLWPAPLLRQPLRVRPRWTMPMAVSPAGPSRVE